MWKEFYGRVRDDKLPHAFLLAGQQGIGVEDLAVAMGQYLLCLSPLDEIACGKCRSCQLLRAETHPDIKLVKAEEEGKMIKVDQVRDIAAFVDQTAQQGGRKIVILLPAEAMNVNAANALLKNLEEPPGNTVFILVSYQTNRVLPTIRSRCTRVVLDLPSYEQAEDWLRQNKIDDIATVMEACKGAPLLGKKWSEEGLIRQRLEIIDDLAKILDRSLEPMMFAKKWAQLEPLVMIEPAISIIDAVVKNKVAKSPLQKHFECFVPLFDRQAESSLLRLRDWLCQQKFRLLRSANLNSMLVIEEVALEWVGDSHAGIKSRG